MDRRWLGWVAAAALGAWGAWNQDRWRRQGVELEALRLAASAVAEPGDPPTAALPVADAGLDRVAAELSALRGEVAMLRKQVEERGVSGGGGAANTAGAGRPGADAGQPPRPVPTFLRSGFMDRAGLPEAVLEGFRQQLGDVAIEGAHFKQSEGRLFYSMESKTPEGRHVELSVDQTGALVRMRRELELAALPETLQGTVMQAVGEAPVRRIAEVFEDGQVAYRVQAKAQNHAVELTLSRDGQLLRSETTVREKKP
jgi:hypothetical protein